MKRFIFPWALCFGVGLVALLARYLLIQPPEVAHQCDQEGGPWWCSLRAAIIMTYAGYGLGYAAGMLAAAAVVWRRTSLGCAALAVGSAALVLYCYEPGAVAMAVGALVLGRGQHERFVGGPRLR